MTAVHAVVAVKGSARGKHRLAGTLTEAQRQGLIEAMLIDVLDALRGCHRGGEGIASINVLTQDAALLPAGVGHIPDQGLGLNAAIAHAAAMLASTSAESMLVLPADLPFVTSEDIWALIAAGRDCCAVIAPDARRLGTNALLLTPPDLIAPAFGEHSFIAHVDAIHVALDRRVMHANAGALRDIHAHSTSTSGLQIVARPGLAHDVDWPADLRSLADKPGGRYQFLDAALRQAS
jgi:2-phospho-L-lactate/phosphoenolpyruvate guanylyltransferase